MRFAAAIAVLHLVGAHHMAIPTRRALRHHAPARMLLSERRITFAAANEGTVVSKVTSVLSTVKRWGPNEWRVFGVAPLEFSTQAIAGGVRLNYFRTTGGGGQLLADGSCTLTFCGDALVLRPERSARGRQEDVLFKLVLDELRRSSECKLAPGLHSLTDTSRVGQLRAKIAAACNYDRKGQYERF